MAWKIQLLHCNKKSLSRSGGDGSILFPTLIAVTRTAQGFMHVSGSTILVGMATLPRINGVSLHANYHRIRCLFDRDNPWLTAGYS